MHKILAVGDIHLKQSIVLPYVEKAADTLDVDDIVFMGDYVDDFICGEDCFMSEIEYHLKWYEENKTKHNIVNLCGNHDWSYLHPDGVLASGCNLNLNPVASDALNTLEVRAAFAKDSMLFTHAGVNRNWAEISDVNISDAESCCSDINKMFDSGDSSINMCASGRGGSDEASGPLWCDQSEIYSATMPIGMPFSQIVGHTPMQHMFNDVYRNGTTCTFTDTLSCTRSGMSYGDGSILLIVKDDEGVIGKGEIRFDDITNKSWETATHSRKVSILNSYYGMQPLDMRQYQNNLVQGYF